MISRLLLRRQLDARLQAIPLEQPPKGGWIRAIRTALGMTMAQLGQRLRVSAPAIADLERREANGSISVARLRSAADALGCDLQIVLVPRVPLAEMVERQAALKAQQEHARLVHTMRLEHQDQGIAQSPDLSELIEQWLTKRASRLWD